MQPERDVRVKRAQRGQITWGRLDLDAEVPADHALRAIAAAVDKLDLRGRYAGLRARGEIAGAPATDREILLGLWASAQCRSDSAHAADLIRRSERNGKPMDLEPTASTALGLVLADRILIAEVDRGLRTAA